MCGAQHSFQVGAGQTTAAVCPANSVCVADSSGVSVPTVFRIHPQLLLARPLFERRAGVPPREPRADLATVIALASSRASKKQALTTGTRNSDPSLTSCGNKNKVQDQAPTRTRLFRKIETKAESDEQRSLIFRRVVSRFTCRQI